ncbi:MAG: sugar phosphate isomerase/epimerase family protein [Planctomycetota bacterium]
MNTPRRQFLSGALGLAAASALTRRAVAQTGAPKTDAQSEKPPAPKPPLFKISLAEWSLHRALEKKEIENTDFPRIAKQDFGIDAIEYVNTFFKEHVTTRGYLAELRKRCDDLGVKSLLIMCDGLGALGDADAKARTKAVENHYPWIDAIAALGGHSIRVNAAGEGARDEVAQRVADSLVKLAERGTTYSISVIVENHGGTSSDGAWLAGVMKRAAHERVGTLPDFGNFDLGGGKQYDRYQGVRELMPFAKAVSAKSHDFDDKGDETGTDYARMLKIVLDAGYRGYIGIEYEGEHLPEREGIAKTKALLERVRSKFS